MSLEQLSISLICIAIVIFCCIKKITKRWITIAMSSAGGLIFIIGSALFVRQHFIPFNTPENAYKYVYGGEAFTVVEGVESDYVIGNKEAKYFNKSEKGWKVPIINISVTKGMRRIGSTTIYVSQYNFSDEYYITVMDSENSSLKIEDNRNSTFYKSNHDENDSDIKSCVYYTYVNKINNEYTITVNGEEVKLFE